MTVSEPILQTQGAGHRLSRLSATKIAEAVAIVILLGLLVAAPSLASRAMVNDLGQAVCLGLFAISFNLLFKYSGLLSFGHAAFFGVAAYAEALLLQDFPVVPIPVLVLAAAFTTGLLGLVLGQLCVRRSGAYFSMTTLAIGALFYAIAFKCRGLTGGTDGLGSFMPDTLLLLPRWTLDNPGIAQTYRLIVAILIPVALAAWALLELTPFGNAVVAVRSNEKRAAFLGYDTHHVKLANFGLAAALAGVAGALWAIDNSFVSTDSIDLSFSTTVIIITFLGGSTWFWGPMIGSVVYIAASDRLSALTPHWQIILGFGFILIVLFAPGGIAGIAQAAWRRASGRAAAAQRIDCDV